MQLHQLCFNNSDKEKRLLSVFLPGILKCSCAMRYKELHTVCGFIHPFFHQRFYHLYRVCEIGFCAISSGANLVQNSQALKQTME